VLLEDESRVSVDFVDQKTGVAPHELCHDLISAGHMVWQSNGYFVLFCVLYCVLWFVKSRILFGNTSELLRSPAQWFWNTKERDSGILTRMLSVITKRSKNGAGLKLADQMSLRAQQAAVSAAIVTPPPFPRVVRKKKRNDFFEKISKTSQTDLGYDCE
jgi:hypothetical protein